MVTFIRSVSLWISIPVAIVAFFGTALFLFWIKYLINNRTYEYRRMKWYGGQYLAGWMEDFRKVGEEHSDFVLKVFRIVFGVKIQSFPRGDSLMILQSRVNEVIQKRAKRFLDVCIKYKELVEPYRFDGGNSINVEDTRPVSRKQEKLQEIINLRGREWRYARDLAKAFGFKTNDRANEYCINDAKYEKVNEPYMGR